MPPASLPPSCIGVRALMVTAAAAVVAFLILPDMARARDLTVALQDQAMLTAAQAAYLVPFTRATSISVAAEVWDGATAALQAHLPTADTGWDIVEIAGADLRAACDHGLLEKIDWPAIGGRENYLPQAVTDCGVGATLTSIALAWDREKFPGMPTWADFWDVAKHPGKRGLRATARTNLEIALLADGVAAGDVYPLLRTDAGVERAFRKLDQLKPYVVWWHSDEEAPRLLGLGDVLMTSAPNDRIAQADRLAHQTFAVQWNGALASVSYWGIVKGTPSRAQADRLLAYMGDPANQARLLPLLARGGLARKVNDHLSHELLAESPTSPAALEGALMVDEKFWADTRDKLEARFAVWASR